MSFTQKYADWFKRLLPSPFSIAVILTLLVLLFSILSTEKPTIQLLTDWQTGLWNTNLLAFGFQMMLMLVLGHTLALSQFFDKSIQLLISPIKNTAQAAALVTFTTIVVAFFNWGLGLIFGAIIARKIGEHFSNKHIKINYPLIGAAGYIGLMVWHGGLSGSALSKVAEVGHLRDIGSNIELPAAITYDMTVFGAMNVSSFIALLLLVPAVYYLMGKRSTGKLLKLEGKVQNESNPKNLKGAEKIDHSTAINRVIGFLMLSLAIYLAISHSRMNLGFITPNYINFTMLSLCLLLHRNFFQFLKSIDKAIQGSSGILIQFPLYFGILALMKSSGLIVTISDFFIDISYPTTLPIFTFMSAALVNIFVPSGGGQWAIQGPIIIEAATQLNVPLPKMIMALAYGDQLTNMLQPFWALPLLSITGLKAKDILPYTLVSLCIGTIIFISVLLIF